eukprot:c3620_g1_i1.p1 GENE.c3620_g1_i1~~c3620_g1_i1.p1  ORF type:complete len:405 (-),score=51.15 c3620_g1_i1:61-1203(-)
MSKLSKLFRWGRSADSTPPDSAATVSRTRPTKNVLVLCSSRTSWEPAFAAFNAGLADSAPFSLVIAQCDWGDLRFQAQCGKPLHVFIRGRSEGFRVDIVLVRSMVRGLTPDVDHRSTLFGLRYAGVPAVNSWESIVACVERPWLHAALFDIKTRLGADAFPLISQTFYPNPSSVSFPPDFPLVAKVGCAEAGYGKIRILDDGQLADVRSVLMIHKDYVTMEPLVPMEVRVCDLRIQKIGRHLRAFKRISPNWKGNVGTSVVTEIPMVPEFEVWANAASTLFGGTDILTVDAIERTDGSRVILEVNDTASGLSAETEAEDMQHICELVFERLIEAATARPAEPAPPNFTSTAAAAAAAAAGAAAAGASADDQSSSVDSNEG